MKKIISKEELIWKYYLLRTDPTWPQWKTFDNKEEMMRRWASHSITLQWGIRMYMRHKDSDSPTYLWEFRYGWWETIQEVIDRTVVTERDGLENIDRTIWFWINDGNEVEVSEAFALEFLSLKTKWTSNNS